MTTWFRWTARTVALAFVVAAVVLVATHPTVGYIFNGQHLTGTCTTPWSEWRHPFNYPVPPQVGTLVSACGPAWTTRWDIAWWFVLGALLIAIASLASSLGYNRMRRHGEVHPA